MEVEQIRCNSYDIVREGQEVVIRQASVDGRVNQIRITRDQAEVFFAHLRIVIGELGQ